MESEKYIDLFRELGFHDIQFRKKLRHRRGMPTVYFNRDRGGFVYFTVYAKDRQAFCDDLWVFLPPRQKKDSLPKFRTVVPKSGKERVAFMNIAG